jgi:hypothetical protein
MKDEASLQRHAQNVLKEQTGIRIPELGRFEHIATRGPDNEGPAHREYVVSVNLLSKVKRGPALQEKEAKVVSLEGDEGFSDPALADLVRQGRAYQGDVVPAHPEALHSLSTLNMAEEQQRDSQLAPYFDFLRDGTLPKDAKLAQRVAVEASFLNYDRESGVLTHVWNQAGTNRVFARLVVPSRLRQMIMHHHHGDRAAGHYGFEKSYATVLRKFWWPGMHSDVSHWCSTCADCQASKVYRRGQGTYLRPIVTPNAEIVT